MLCRLFKRPKRLVEIKVPSGQKQVMSHDEYILKTIAEKKAEAELLHMGISTRRESDRLIEDVMRRWMI